MAYDLLSGKRTPRDWSCDLDSSMGSFLFPAKEQKALFAKIDDARFDMRSLKGTLGAGLFTLSGALAFLGVASVYRTSKLASEK